MTISAVTFDAGQTLIDLDSAMLVRRLGERGLSADPAAIDASFAAAWQTYEAGVVAGVGHPWQALMRAWLGLAAPHLDATELADAVAWLWREQPTRNLWRRPRPGMIELVDDLRRGGVKVAVISNSEGGLAALFDEIGWHGRFDAIADSGALGMEKPGRGIFDWTCAQLGVAAASVIHVGDSWPADVEGARAAGMQAIWFGPLANGRHDQVAACADAAELRLDLSQRLTVVGPDPLASTPAAAH